MSKMNQMIVERKKNEDLDQIMYSEDFDDGAAYKDVQDSCDGEEEVTRGKANKKKKRLSKGAKPREIAEDGSLYSLSATREKRSNLRGFVARIAMNMATIRVIAPKRRI
jgi:hypothetical protein